MRKPGSIGILGVIGDPISHSLSPAMHNAAFRKKRWPLAYLPFRVPPAELGRFLKRARSWRDLVGFNVTIPHKEAVLGFLDRVSPEAKAIGAANTILVSKGRLVGFNTDGEGYLRSLAEETGFRPKRRTILVLGAGGASRAVLFALAKAGAGKILVANRTASRATALIREFQKEFPRTRFEALPLRPLQGVLPVVDLLVNTTSVGMKGTRFSGLSLVALNPKAVVSDLVYRPVWTPLLRQARRLGLKTHTGLGMLLHQGALSARIWTGKTPDLAAMKKALLDGLKRT